MTMNIAAALLHGAVDPSFPSKVAIAAVQPASETFTESESIAVKTLRDQIRDKIAAEVNRIEAAASLMLSHVEGQYESKVANIRVYNVLVPTIAGALSGAIVGFILGRIV